MRFLPIAFLFLSVNSLAACTSCFGKVTGNLANGLNMALIFLLCVTAAVLAGFASFFIYLWRQSKLVKISNPITRIDVKNTQPSGEL
ncbi:MAG: hypothetical protein DF168_00339 [Candidatus Moanabacter tarae]|uniref:Uncharacterized protein n=1 Tax=Candidatus Moanibacter tarae TaxID=2200854 RepID=A0A2Z4AB71_9BACT|nr:MAG: hypothetical protein DF168_00339 [Candidatus Moanabacter tarae]